jgi:hypothetical protein
VGVENSIFLKTTAKCGQKMSQKRERRLWGILTQSLSDHFREIEFFNTHACLRQLSGVIHQISSSRASISMICLPVFQAAFQSFSGLKDRGGGIQERRDHVGRRDIEWRASGFYHE